MKFNGKNITELLAVNRRNFIKLVVGGAFGTVLTPLPWKLIDDTAIFTQNLPWVPVPEKGKFTEVKSHCTLCPGGCGIEVRKAGDRAVKIEGRTDDPINPGGICPLGMGGLQLLYDENDRFTGPMKRIGSRGSGKFQSISWEEALSTLANRILELRNKGNVGQIVAVDGNRSGSTMSLLIERFLKAIGSPNYMRIPTSDDTSRMVANRMFGSNEPLTYDLENSDYILSFGCGLLEGWGAPGRILNAWGLWKSSELKDKVRIVQLEPRASNTASKAGEWLAVKPGTEAALALGMASVIIKEDLYDSEFVDNYTRDFLPYKSKDGKANKGFKELVLEKYTPESVSMITGITPDQIKSIARAFATAKEPVAICGKGKGLLNGDTLEFLAVNALNVLTGRINKPGGVYIQDPIPLGSLPDVVMDQIASNGLKQPRLDKSDNSSLSLFQNFTDAIQASDKPVVDTILVFSSNPAFTLPDGGAFYNSLVKTPYIVSFSPYHDETAFMADLILPDHTYLEKTDDILHPPTIQYPFYALTQPVVDLLYNTKNSGDAIIDLAGKIGGAVKESFPWKNYDDVLKLRIKGLFESGQGQTVYNPNVPPWKLIGTDRRIKQDFKDLNNLWRKMKKGGFWYNPTFKIKKYDRLFTTRSGKAKFCSNCFGSIVQETHLETGNNHESMYPLKMVPYELINLSSGWAPNPPYLYKTIFDNQLLKNDSFVEINPETAKQYKLTEGDKIYIISQAGRVEAKVHLFDGAMPDVVFMPMGFGHTAYDDFIRGKGCSPRSIMMNDKRDMLSGQPAWWSTPVRINKVDI